LSLDGQPEWLQPAAQAVARHSLHFELGSIALAAEDIALVVVGIDIGLAVAVGIVAVVGIVSDAGSVIVVVAEPRSHSEVGTGIELEAVEPDLREIAAAGT
jgi:hypothetical protein